MPSSFIPVPAGRDERFDAYLATPDSPNGGSIVVLQEIFGVNGYIRSVCDAFAAEGYFAIAPDLFWRQERLVALDPAVPDQMQRALALSQSLDHGQAVADALAAAAVAREQPGANGKVAAVGFCLGGKLAYLMAMEPGIDAGVAYYGVAIQASLADMGKVTAPLLLHIAADDHLCPPDAQAAIAAAAAENPKVEIITHDGVGHGFARRGPTYDAVAAERADAATAQRLRASLT
ncbi:MAG: dienelactone hydrolase family protein [Sphingomonas adhaesiva]|uniref:dienelactone hydrolase family protein n=1 Tax=Sphingomonas adhaesiva TaxID=28212 RepID=UPI002FF7C0EF